jgi:D-glycero-D-manno-heptose 1,7-bisphosphate phosphatase
MTRAVIFLDRDGTLNVDQGYIYRPEDWEFTDRALEALRDLREAGYSIALVTNQSGIGRGYFTLDDVHVLHQHVQERLGEQGVRLDAVAVCPHAPGDGCECRKPRTGMARQIETQLGEPIAYNRSWVIGDKLCDLDFGRALGVQVALLQSRYWDAARLQEAPALIANSLYESAQAILDACRRVIEENWPRGQLTEHDV